MENYINTYTTHVADIVKLPSPESDFRGLIASYRAFYQLDMSGFDLVVSCKYPAWMVRHPRHVVYLLHKLRGLYDTYSGWDQLPSGIGKHNGLRNLLMIAERLKDRGEPDEFFDAIDALTFRSDAEEQSFLSFPGPLVRQVVQALDAYALAPSRIAKYGAISHVVARRRDYFPAGNAVEVLYPPTGLTFEGARGEVGKYLFTASRLDGPKRIGLLVEAMRYVGENIRLMVAGTGPLEDALKQASARDPRIEWLGYVSDRRLEELYAGALAVLFMPEQEDYGLIALEGMLAGKPIITAHDSGGPTELVEHGVTGWVVAPEPKALAGAIEELLADPEQGLLMGERAAERARMVGWAPILEWMTC
ncbi:MAG: glycosyltransferase family 4 protein [Methylococcus sp.]|nr:glycosyltransferase family 4 protein [Methylococcus sp.]